MFQMAYRNRVVDTSNVNFWDLSAIMLTYPLFPAQPIFQPWNLAYGLSAAQVPPQMETYITLPNVTLVNIGFPVHSSAWVGPSFMTMTFILTETTSHTSTRSVALSYQETVDRSAPDVTLFYPTAETSYRVHRIILPQGSKFQAGAHWHEESDEHMRVVKGRANIMMGNAWKVYTPEDGEVMIPKNVIHDIRRAYVGAKAGEEDEGDLIMEERADPSDGSKELSFRHVFSSVTDKAVFGWKLPLQQLLVFMYSDGYIVTVPGPAAWYATHGLYAVLRPLAKWLGLKPFYDEYTPKRLENIRKELEERGQKKTV